MKKALLYLGWALFLVFAVISTILMFNKEDTVDLRGTVKEITFSQNAAEIKVTPIFNEDNVITITADKSIKVKTVYGEKYSLEKIKSGDQIDVNYKGELEHSKAKAKSLAVLQS